MDLSPSLISRASARKSYQPPLLPHKTIFDDRTETGDFKVEKLLALEGGAPQEEVEHPDEAPVDGTDDSRLIPVNRGVYSHPQQVTVESERGSFLLNIARPGEYGDEEPPNRRRSSAIDYIDPSRLTPYRRPYHENNPLIRRIDGLLDLPPQVRSADSHTTRGLPAAVVRQPVQAQRFVDPSGPVLQPPGVDTDKDNESKESLLRQIKKLRIENDRLAELCNHQEPTRSAPYQWLTIYSVSGHPHLEEPSWVKVGRDRFKLKSGQSIRSISDYVDHHPEVVFLWLKWYDGNSSPDFSTEASEAPGGDILPRPQSIRQRVKITDLAMRTALGAFLDLIPNFESDPFITDGSNDINEPSLLCFRIRHHVDTALAQLDNDLDIGLMELFWNWAMDAFARDWHRIDSEFTSGLVSRFSIKFLFQPGEVVISTKGQLVSYIASTWAVYNDGKSAPGPLPPGRARESDVESGESDSDFLMFEKSQGNKTQAHESHWFIACWSWNFDGSLLRKERRIVLTRDVFKNDHSAKITSLNLYPLRCDSPTLREQLVKRGQIFESCRQRRLVSLASGGGASSETESEGDRYMVDAATYGELRKRSEQLKREKSLAVLNGEFENGNEGTVSDREPEGDEKLVFPNAIIGYDLRRKIWIDIEVDRICEVSWNLSAFDSLAIDADDKELVQALVTNQIESSKGTDIIADKGTGLIILLHGGPGTGKTFTAESLADLARKPLYRVTCGDIGTNAEQVEKYLESVLHLGRVWDCVVLLDEADVFLEERSRDDLARNALVSVFLRILEYYQGILILTSNRVGTFDEAFKSRVQLALHYRPLESWQRRKIWRNFIERLRRLESRGEVSIDFDDISDHMGELVDSSMNGREIRNAVTSARQLALYRKEILQYKHLRHVIAVAAKFEAYSRGVNEGLTDEDMARDGGIR